MIIAVTLRYSYNDDRPKQFLVNSDMLLPDENLIDETIHKLIARKEIMRATWVDVSNEYAPDDGWKISTQAIITETDRIDKVLDLIIEH